MNDEDPPANEWEWPFSLADITAGLRRYLVNSSIRVVDVRQLPLPHGRPSIGRVRALKVDYQSSKGEGSCRLVVKEPLGTTRTGLAGAGRREVGVYKSLVSHVPVSTPALVAASPVGDWLILETLEPTIEPSDWTKKDYKVAIVTLAEMHDRFWGLGEDLGTFTWLSRPLDSDFEIHVTAAAQAIERIVHSGEPKALAKAPHRLQVLASLSTQADQIVEPLARQPSTLLHGDYWPGNIAVIKNSTQVVYDWQLAGVGPGVIDLLVFVNKSAWWFGRLPMSRKEIVELYRREIKDRLGFVWSEDEWDELWDHALMWRFLQEWVDLLAASPEALLEVQAEHLDDVWLAPVTEAVSRRLTTAQIQ